MAVIRNPRTVSSRPRYGAVRRLAGRGIGGLAPPREWAYLTGDPYPAGVWPASESEAMGLPPFGRGVALLCNAVAGTDWAAVRWDPALGV